MHNIIAQPLTHSAFQPFGTLIESPSCVGRLDFSQDLENMRAHAKLSLSTIRVHPLPLPLSATLMERHQFSSQSFIPLNVTRYLVIVAPAAPSGGPDVSNVCAFVAQAGQGITYRVGVWHHGMTVLDQPAEFAIVMWRDWSDGDEEFITLAEPFSVDVFEQSASLGESHE